MTDPGSAPDNELPYRHHADENISAQDMEALGANAEQDWDIDQVIRHNLYIGWIMGIINGKDISAIHHGGGNRLNVYMADESQITLVVPYPPKDWSP